MRFITSLLLNMNDIALFIITITPSCPFTELKSIGIVGWWDDFSRWIPSPSIDEIPRVWCHPRGKLVTLAYSVVFPSMAHRAIINSMTEYKIICGKLDGGNNFHGKTISQPNWYVRKWCFTVSNYVIIMFYFFPGKRGQKGSAGPPGPTGPPGKPMNIPLRALLHY